MSRVRVADVRVPPPAGWVMTIAVVAWASCIWIVRLRRKSWTIRRIGSDWALWTVLATLPVIAAATLWPEPALLFLA